MDHAAADGVHQALLLNVVLGEQETLAALLAATSAGHGQQLECTVRTQLLALPELTLTLLAAIGSPCILPLKRQHGVVGVLCKPCRWACSNLHLMPHTDAIQSNDSLRHCCTATIALLVAMRRIIIKDLINR